LLTLIYGGQMSIFAHIYKSCLYIAWSYIVRGDKTSLHDCVIWDRFHPIHKKIFKHPCITPSYSCTSLSFSFGPVGYDNTCIAYYYAVPSSDTLLSWSYQAQNLHKSLFGILLPAFEWFLEWD